MSLVGQAPLESYVQLPAFPWQKGQTAWAISKEDDASMNARKTQTGVTNANTPGAAQSTNKARSSMTTRTTVTSVSYRTQIRDDVPKNRGGRATNKIATALKKKGGTKTMD